MNDFWGKNLNLELKYCLNMKVVIIPVMDLWVFTVVLMVYRLAYETGQLLQD